jgi:nucleolar protein 12
MSGTSSSLASLFSETSKVNFARVNKSKEIKSKKRTAEEVRGGEAEEQTPKRIKKPKHKHSKKVEISEKISDSQADATTLPVGEEKEEKDEKDQRTIFAGNIPITATITSLKTFFQEFGPVDSVRLRSVPIAGTAVDVKGNQDLVRKVCVNQGKFGDQKGSFNAYIVFKNKESVERSLVANNRLMGERHLRVDRLNPTLFNPKTSVFLGGLPFYTDEEELREHFAKVVQLFTFIFLIC